MQVPTMNALRLRDAVNEVPLVVNIPTRDQVIDFEIIKGIQKK